MTRLRAAALGILAALGAAALPASPAHAEADVFSLAGSTDGSFADGLGTAARFNLPSGVSMDREGSVYVADANNHCIRRVTAGGQVTTLAGSSEGTYRDGRGAEAGFNQPAGVDVGEDGNIYVADYQNGKVRRISPDGYVATVAGGDFARPRDVAYHRGDLFVSESDAGWVRRVNQATGESTVAIAGLTEPWGVDVDVDGNLYVADYGKQRIVKLAPSGKRSVFGSGNYGVQDGPARKATFGRPAGVDVDPVGNVYVADKGTHRIRRITRRGRVDTIAGGHEGFDDGNAFKARFDEPIGIVSDGAGVVYVGDSKNQRIRKISGVSGRPSTTPDQRPQRK